MFKTIFVIKRGLKPLPAQRMATEVAINCVCVQGSMCILQGSYKCLRILLSNSPDVSVKDNDGR